MLCLFQMTVATTHPVKSHCLDEELVALAKNPVFKSSSVATAAGFNPKTQFPAMVYLFWVVPSEAAQSFKKQPFWNMDLKKGTDTLPRLVQCVRQCALGMTLSLPKK